MTDIVGVVVHLDDAQVNFVGQSYNFQVQFYRMRFLFWRKLKVISYFHFFLSHLCLFSVF